MSQKLRVGLIGVGLMGHGMGKNIVTKGFPLTVLGHRNRQPVESLMALGATEARSARDLAQSCDLVLICVTGSREVEAIVYRADGLLAGMHPGLVLADCSTAEPASTLKIAAEVAAKGGHFVDTPLTRTPKEAEAGKLGMMTGGDPAVIARIKPVLSCFADTFVHAGSVGAAHKLKLINNFLALGTAAIVSEAITAGAKEGVDMQALHDIVTAGGANSVMFERLIKVPLADDDSTLKFFIKNACKDLRYYTNMTEAAPMTSFLAEAVHQTYILAANTGYAERYVPRLIDALCQVNAIAKTGKK